MSRSRAPLPGVLLVAIVSLVAGAPASGQTVCITPNCVSGGTPAPCVNRAAPRTPTVLMGSGALVFIPANPKIEPGECIVWRSASATHDSSENGCTDDPICGAPPVAACRWDAANVSSVSATPFSTCFYDAALFPATTADNFYCRIHASPTVGTMRGTLRVTTAIQLTMGKDLATSSVKLNWIGGGVTGDISYKVARQSAGDPKFPIATTTTVNPDGGVLGTALTDAGDLGNSTTRYYLVRNKQTNEP